MLVERGVATLRAITDEHTRALHRHYFERASFDKELGGMTDIKAALLLARSQGEDKALERALPILVMEAIGEPSSMCEDTVRTHRRMLRKYGLAGTNVTMASSRSVSLDYDTGTLRSS